MEEHDLMKQRLCKHIFAILWYMVLIVNLPLEINSTNICNILYAKWNNNDCSHSQYQYERTTLFLSLLPAKINDCSNDDNVLICFSIGKIKYFHGM